jgi:cell division septum initiation protein DivIVA
MTEKSPITQIEQHSLPTALRGYERGATDKLLEDLKTAVTTLVSEREAAQARAKELEGRFAALEEREKEITEALVVVSRVKAETDREAKEKGDAKIREAEAEAERITARARASAQTFLQEAHQAEQLAVRAREQLTAFLQSLLAEIERRGADLGSLVDDLVKRASSARLDWEPFGGSATPSSPQENRAAEEPPTS